MLPDRLRQRLHSTKAGLMSRSLTTRAGLDFSSNDYLAFASDPELSHRLSEALRDLPFGSSGSRLLRGHLDLHEKTEAELARYTNREAALLFPSGYQANVCLFSALLQEGDMVFSDEFNHASIIDGIRLSRAKKQIYPHGDYQTLEGLLKNHPAGKGLRIVVTESLYSMEGDVAPLREIGELCKTHEALLVVDESHATGLFGRMDEGRAGGVCDELGMEESVFATVHTGGKSLGASGAWISGDHELKEYLVNFGRGFIFSTAPAPALTVSLGLSLSYWKEVGVRRSHGLKETCGIFSKLLEACMLRRGFDVSAAKGPIFPFILGEAQRALSVADKLQKAGFDARAIRPPTVPGGRSRLRITLNAKHTQADLQSFIDALESALEANG